MPIQNHVTNRGKFILCLCSAAPLVWSFLCIMITIISNMSKTGGNDHIFYFKYVSMRSIVFGIVFAGGWFFYRQGGIRGSRIQILIYGLGCIILSAVRFMFTTVFIISQEFAFIALAYLILAMAGLRWSETILGFRIPWKQYLFISTLIAIGTISTDPLAVPRLWHWIFPPDLIKHNHDFFHISIMSEVSASLYYLYLE